MSELRIFVIATIFMLAIGGLLPLIVGSFMDTDVEITGLRLTTYNFINSGIDLTGSFDVPSDDSFYDYLAGIELIISAFPLFNAFIYLYLFIVLYTIVKALPLT